MPPKPPRPWTATGNAATPQKHEHEQDPSEEVLPVPETMVPVLLLPELPDPTDVAEPAAAVAMAVPATGQPRKSLQ